MKKQFYIWAVALVSQFIEGACDSFLIITGGNALAQTGATAMPAVTLKQLVLSILLGGAIYAASYLKKNPVPITAATLAEPVPPAVPPAI